MDSHLFYLWSSVILLMTQTNFAPFSSPLSAPEASLEAELW